MLEGLLSPGAAAFYARLLDSGPLPPAGDAGADAAPSVVQELSDLGFVTRRRDGRIEPVAPTLAIEHAALTVQQRVVADHQRLARARAEVPSLQQRYDEGAPDGPRHVFVESLREPTAVAQAIRDLWASARSEVLTFAVEPRAGTPQPRVGGLPPRPADMLDASVQVRSVFARTAIEEHDGAPVRNAIDSLGDARVAPRLPFPMIVVDERAALLPLDETAVSAVVVRAAVVVRGLRACFDLVWERATPLGGGAPDAITETQQRILELVAAGMKDETIARHVGTSVRTLRRQVTQLEGVLGASNRVALVVAAMRKGWLH